MHTALILINLLMPVLLAVVISTAWHRSIFSIIATRSLFKLRGKKFPDEIVSVDDYQLWCISNWPFPEYVRGTFLSCGYCTAPYFALLTLPAGAYGFHLAGQTTDYYGVVSIGAMVWLLSTHYTQRQFYTRKPITTVTTPSETPTEEVTQTSPTHRLIAYRKLSDHEKQRNKTEARKLWNDFIGITQTQDESGRIVISSKSTDNQLPSLGLSFFISAPIKFGGDAARKLQLDYQIDLKAFSDSGECLSCSPESHIQHLYYREIIEILSNLQR